jgi:hypothetical protein
MVSSYLPGSAGEPIDVLGAHGQCFPNIRSQTPTRTSCQCTAVVVIFSEKVDGAGVTLVVRRMDAVDILYSLVCSPPLPTNTYKCAVSLRRI